MEFKSNISKEEYLKKLNIDTELNKEEEKGSLPQTNIEDTRKIELASISDKIKHLNDMLNEDDEIINKKTL